MLTAECWIALHDNCDLGEWCECLCHAVLDELMEELGDDLGSA